MTCFTLIRFEDDNMVNLRVIYADDEYKTSFKVPKLKFEEEFHDYEDLRKKFVLNIAGHVVIVEKLPQTHEQDAFYYYMYDRAYIQTVPFVVMFTSHPDLQLTIYNRGKITKTDSIRMIYNRKETYELMKEINVPMTKDFVFEGALLVVSCTATMSEAYEHIIQYFDDELRFITPE